jgi:SAM-dependent methyltransferase
MNDIVRNSMFAVGKKMKSMGEKLITRSGLLKSKKEKIKIFQNETYQQINNARLKHLASLNLPLTGKTVLEVGAGIGLHTHFFEELGCKVVSTDGRQENVDDMKQHFPNRDNRLFNLLDFDSYASFGEFDVVYCYGTLYHTPKPDEILKGLSSLSREMLLLETCVTPGEHIGIHLTRETESFDQAIGIVGCRPTRPWIMETLKKYCGYSYVTKTQPNHIDFDLDWQIPVKKQNHRAVFVGSKKTIINPLLLTDLPDFQERN